MVHRDAYARNRVARHVAAGCGAAAFLLFFQPWVSASLPALGVERLTGLQLARGEAAERVDRAQFSSPPGTGAAAPAAAGSAGLTLPTRIPTVAPGGVASGGLVLPTRIPTVQPGATQAPSAAQAGTGQLAGGAAAGSVLEAGRAAPRPAEPERLPRMSLYLLPAAALALAVFALVWDRLPEARDRRFGVLWTILVSFGGSAVTGWLLFKTAAAPPGNDLLDPGTVTAAEWALWALLVAFLTGAAAVTAAWVSPRPPPPSPFGQRAVL
jgi:hypothetical protein